MTSLGTKTVLARSNNRKNIFKRNADKHGVYSKMYAFTSVNKVIWNGAEGYDRTADTYKIITL